MKNPFAALAVAIVVALSPSCVRGPSSALIVGSPTTIALANDNRVPAGTIRNGVLRLDLDAVWAGWRPDADVDTAVTVQAFAERGRTPTIPGPLLRVAQGTEVRATIRNLIPDSTLTVYGLRAGSAVRDTVSIAPGATREIVFTARSAGTFHYWGTTSGTPLWDRSGRDSQLSGAIVVDAIGASIDPRERIFVISLIEIGPDTGAPPPQENIWEVAINGRSWPHTERLEYAVGDTARWRWINASNRGHPMHLHGFHFRVLSKGDGAADSSYARDGSRLAVTELVESGGTLSLEWIPRRAGNWLVHCHMIPHIVPFPRRAADARGHDVHDQSLHPFQSMAGLVLGVTTTGPDVAPGSPEPAASKLRLLVQQNAATRPVRKSYVLQRGAEPAADSVVLPGSPLIVTRGEKTTITVVNRLSEPTSVHWHGIELESLFDGVAGYSGIGSMRAPLIVPGDSFTVSFTPPRAGTFMYHTHMDEEDQLAAGMYGPIIVLEPGERYDPETDLSFIIGLGLNNSGGRGRSINGEVRPAPRTLRAGVTYRLRIMNLLPAAPGNLELTTADSSIGSWRLISKDGASRQRARALPARVRIAVGEAYDFEWTPRAGESVLTARFTADPTAPAETIRQRFVVRP
ncbi:MAG: multicopper oxidase domain-containing protein [Gemmatimonadaceae bacterium]